MPDKFDRQTLQVMQWFLKKGIRAFGPTIGILLVQIRDEIRVELKKDADLPDDIRSILDDYAYQLDNVATIGAIHQAAVIGKLEAILEMARSKK